MITKVRIKGYKSLEDVSIELKPLTVFVGPNAAGKSNLFDALGLLSRMATRRTVKEAFDEHRGEPLETFFYGTKGLAGLLERETASFTIEVEVALSERIIEAVERQIRESREGLPAGVVRRRVLERRLRYAVTVGIQTRSGNLRVLDENLLALNQDGTVKQSRKPFIEKSQSKLHLRLEGQASHPTYHDIGLDHALISRPLYPPHYPHVTAFREEASRWQFFYLEPHAMRADIPLKEVSRVRPNGGELAAFYNTLRLANNKQFEAIKRCLTSIIPTVEDLEVELSRQGDLQLRIVEGGTQFSSRIISEGTLRILGLLAITSSEATAIGYEEPENGVHPRRLQLIAGLLKNATERKNATETSETQVLVNTHSPELADFFCSIGDSESIVVCQKEGVSTSFHPLKSLGPLFYHRDVDRALAETSFGQRLMRGDFGG